jgi:hypothetical protein
MVDLSSLTFGAPAAERDIDQGLEAYFVDTEAFRKVRAGSKTIIPRKSWSWQECHLSCYGCPGTRCWGGDSGASP